ncbi:MAG: rod shape-determining protein MreC, partial [Gammaproteobacteria bacterium]|nr:rod shape-determining protein MreC [Gammaproteobacteria bacterium]
LLRSERNPLEKRLVAEIIQIDSDPFSRKFMINKGSINDVYIGQVVIDSYGIIGQVVEVGILNSRVIMLTDATHAIPVKIARNGNRMIAYGTGKNDSLLVPFVPDTTDIKTGDLLLTSGLGRRFKSGYPVATVTSVERISGQAFSRIIASPTAKLDQTASVLLVWSEDDVEKE